MNLAYIYVPATAGGGGGGGPTDPPLDPPDLGGGGYVGSNELRRRVRIPSPGFGADDPYIYTTLSGAAFDSAIIHGADSGATGLLVDIFDDGAKRWLEFYGGTRNGIPFRGGELINVQPKGQTVIYPTEATIYDPYEEVVV